MERRNITYKKTNIVKGCTIFVYPVDVCFTKAIFQEFFDFNFAFSFVAISFHTDVNFHFERNSRLSNSSFLYCLFNLRVF